METAYTLLLKNWIEVDQAPDYFSFRCLIKFEEFGLNGPAINHISTGYWWHKNNCFSVDDLNMEGMTPKYFIPLHDYIAP